VCIADGWTLSKHLDIGRLKTVNSVKPIMKTLLSPKELAAAIGVSESTVKRWVDDGVIPASKTVGGHRRIALNDAVQYIRQHQPLLIEPSALGLSEVAQPGMSVAPLTQELLYDALVAGESSRVRGLIIAAYLSGQSLARIFDGPIAEAMQRIGELWKHDSSGIFHEHRAVDLVISALSQLRLTLPRLEADAPMTVGGAATGDPYILPALMATIVLSDAGFRDQNLGPNTPIQTLRHALEQCSPRVVWFSVSSTPEPEKLSLELREFLEHLATFDVALILGGRGCDQLRLPPMQNLHRARSMAELEAFARGLINNKKNNNKA
jgi:MerR family transcriptional regulator, light-induced transcriptional regulator